MKRYFDCSNDGDCEHCSYRMEKNTTVGMRIFDCQGIRADKPPVLSSYSEYPLRFYKLHTLYDLFVNDKYFSQEDKKKLVEDLCARLRNSIGRKPFDCKKDVKDDATEVAYRSAGRRRVELAKKTKGRNAIVKALRKEVEKLEIEQQMLKAKVAILKNENEEIKQEIDSTKE